MARKKDWFNPYHIEANQRSKRKASSTPGRQKQGLCTTTSLLKYLCKHNRSYKHKLYGTLSDRIEKAVKAY